MKAFILIPFLFLAACASSTQDACVPPQQWVNGACIDRDGSGDGQGTPDAPESKSYRKTR